MHYIYIYAVTPTPRTRLACLDCGHDSIEKVSNRNTPACDQLFVKVWRLRCNEHVNLCMQQIHRREYVVILVSLNTFGNTIVGCWFVCCFILFLFLFFVFLVTAKWFQTIRLKIQSELYHHFDGRYGCCLQSVEQ